MPVKGAIPAIGFPLLAAIDWRYALAVALGIVAGWFCRAAVPYAARKPWPEIRREFILSVMISGGSVLATLWFADVSQADALTAAMIAWTVAFGGLDALTMTYRYVLLPVRKAIGNTDDEGPKRQSQARHEAAERLGENAGGEDVRELLRRIEKAQRRQHGDPPPIEKDERDD